jgi:subtilisin family serine protease
MNRIIAVFVVSGGLLGAGGAAAQTPRAELVSAIVTIRGTAVASQPGVFAAPLKPGLMLRAEALRPSAAALARAETNVIAAQAPVLASAQALGVQVIDRYTTATNGLLVHGTPAQLAALRRLPGVVAVEAAPLVHPTLERAVPYVGAARLAAESGFTGAGAVVAIIDTGIDYTHADLGGPGDPAAFEAANRAPTQIDDEWQGQALFPSPKVVGGWDFVGSRYTSPAFCSAANEASGRCVSTPRPDADPLDERSGNWADGHGTHVSGIVAGVGTASVPKGVAPGATLVGLKVFGLPASGVQPDTPSDVLVSAFEWCTRVNLGLAVPGTPPARVDVINMSLGGWYDAGGLAYRQALAAARNAGIVIVAAAGNDDDNALVVNGPGTAAEALSVASASLPGRDGYDPVLRDLGSISSFSARGPGANGTLKPDLTAPGQNIVSAGFGTGNGSRGLSGTSMATPMVAGAAALLVERDRSQGLGLTAVEIAGMLMNQAQFGVSADGATAPVARQGAGMLDVYRAGTATLLATAGDIASINLGAVSLDGSLHVERALTLRNLTDQVVHVRPEIFFRRGGWPGRGISVTPTAERISVPANGTASLGIAFDLAWPSDIASDWGDGNDGVDEGRLSSAEADGRVLLARVDESGQPVSGQFEPAVPFYVLPRPASDIRAAESRPGRPELVNQAALAGLAELFPAPDGAPLTDPDEADVREALDVRHVAARFGPDTGTSVPPSLEFGVALGAPLATAQLTSLEFYLDTNRDGTIDWRLQTGPEVLFDDNGDVERMRVMASRWDAVAGAATGGEVFAGSLRYRLFSRVMLVSVDPAAMGLSGPIGFGFYLIHRGLNERWRPGPEFDVVPDGADEPGGARYVFAPPTWSPGPSWHLIVPAEGQVDLPAEALLALFPDNRFEPEGGQFALVIPGAPPTRPAVFLPMLLR